MPQLPSIPFNKRRQALRIISDLNAEQGKQIIYWNKNLKGFGVVVSAMSKTTPPPPPTRSYMVQRDINKWIDGEKVRKAVAITIGRVEVLDFDDAHTEAKRLIGLLSKNVDPREQKAAQDREEAKSSITLKKAFEDMLESKAADIREITKKDYEHTFVRYFEQWYQVEKGGTAADEWSAKRLCDITRAMVVKHHADIKSVVARKGKGTRYITGDTVADKAMGLLGQVYRYVNNVEQLRLDDPVPVLKEQRRRRKGKTSRTNWIEPDDMSIWMGALKQEWNQDSRDAILLMLFTGLRRNQAVALSWDEVDLEKATITIPIERVKNAKEPHQIPMSDFVLEMLTERKKIGGEYVFPRTRGRETDQYGNRTNKKHLTDPKDVLDRIEKPNDKNTGVSSGKGTGIRCTNHDLRRTFSNYALEETGNIPTVMEVVRKRLLGHDLSDDVSSHNYTSLRMENLRKNTQRITNKIKFAGEIMGYNIDFGLEIEKRYN